MELSKEDIGILIESLDAWLKRDLSGELLGDLMGTLFFKGEGNELERKKFEEERKIQKVKKEVLKQNDEEIAALLKSKLILMKRSL